MDETAFRELRARSAYVAYTDDQKRWTFRAKVWLAGWACWLLLRLWAGTCRLTVVGREPVDARLARGEPMIFASWHQGLVYLFHYSRTIPAGILSSRSDDGQIASELIRRARDIPICGSSSRGGAAALVEMLELLGRGVSIAVLVDGPRGPARKCRRGVVRLAQRSRAPLVPTVVHAERGLRLRNWDRTLLPRPFSRVVIIHGELVEVPEEASSAESRAVLAEFDASLNRLQDQAEAWFDRPGSR